MLCQEDLEDLKETLEAYILSDFQAPPNKGANSAQNSAESYKEGDSTSVHGRGQATDLPDSRKETFPDAQSLVGISFEATSFRQSHSCFCRTVFVSLYVT